MTNQYTETSPRQGLLAYFQRQRATAIRRYRTARFWVTRKDARMWALHYSRLIRKVEGRS